MEKVIHPKLNELQATAICGNDISSSCLYVSALTIMQAGNRFSYKVAELGGVRLIM